jgi:hypothetical protein
MHQLQWAILKVFQRSFFDQMLTIKDFCDSLPHVLSKGCSPAENNQDLRSL